MVFAPTSSPSSTPSPPVLTRLVEQIVAVLAVGACAATAGMASWGAASPTVELRPAAFAIPTEYTLKVHLNRDPWRRFTLIPGIGETMAKRIVEHREKFGPFTTLDGLRRVHGVGDKSLAKWRPYLTLD